MRPHPIKLGFVSDAWLTRLDTGRCYGHIVDAHLPTPDIVIDYGQTETRANVVDARMMEWRTAQEWPS